VISKFRRSCGGCSSREAGEGLAFAKLSPFDFVCLRAGQKEQKPRDAQSYGVVPGIWKDSVAGSIMGTETGIYLQFQATRESSADSNNIAECSVSQILS
jgi:hypothetical protein